VIRAIRQNKEHPIMGLFNLCDRFKTLPEAGSVMEQDCFVMDAFNLIIEEMNKKSKTRK